MKNKSEKITDWSGTIGDFIGMNNTTDNTEIDENTQEYKEWRKSAEAILTVSDKCVEKICYETTNNGNVEGKNESFKLTIKDGKRDIVNVVIKEETQYTEEKLKEDNQQEKD